MLPSSRTHLWILALLYGVTLVYLNLIPLDFRPLPLDEWLRQAMAMPWLKLGLASRADWVANLLMAAPFGFLVASALGAPSGKGRANSRLSAYDVSSIAPTRAGRLAAILLGGPVVVALILVIEIVQILFPQRTISLNDLVAGWLGGAIGILAWTMAGERLWRLAWEAAHPNRRTLLAGIGLYTLAYAALSLFPYDFILNAGELADKFNTVHLGFMSESCSSASRCVASVLAEILAVVPLGVGLALWRDGPISGPRGYLLALVVGALFGLMIEFLQIFIYSGISQGLSVMTRALGVALGWALSGWLFARPLEDRRFQLRPWALWALSPYVLAVFVLNGLAAAQWGGWSTASKQMSEARFMPFYFHYFTTETAAMASLIGVFGLFLPVGFAIWPWQVRFQHPFRIAVIAGAALATVVESSKLFAVGLHPDPTNVLIAAVGAWSGLGSLNWLAFALRARTDGRTGVSQPSAPSTHVMPVPPIPRPQAGEGSEGLADVRHGGLSVLRALSIMLGALVVGLAVTWPVAAPVLVPGLAGYVLWLWRRPQAWLLVVPALVPVLDLTPFTGRIFFNEWDLLVLATLAVGWYRCPSWAGTGFRLPRSMAWALGLYVASTLVSLAITLWPLPPVDANAFSSHMSPYHGLRVAKGLAWALLLASLLGRFGLSVREELERWFVPGMTLGLVGVVATVLWDRATHPGLFDFITSYRATGLFSDMQLGGPTIETFQVLVLPFALLLIWRLHRGWALALATVFLISVAYAALVTYSRGGYLGTVLALVVLGVALVADVRGARLWDRAFALAVVSLPLLFAIVLLTGLEMGSGFFWERMSGIRGDIGQRGEHWSRSLTVRSEGMLPALFGEGIGGYPRARLLNRLDQDLPLNFRYEPGRLQLGPGDPVYFDQRISLARRTDYRLRARARALDGPASLSLFVCEKHIIQSYECEHFSMNLPPGGEWREQEFAFNSGNMGTGPWYARRVLTASLAHGGGGLLEVDSVSLRGPDGREILQNGDFEQGGRYWFYAVDRYESYRAENQWLEVYLDQGWFGLLSFVMLLGTALVPLSIRAVRGALAEATCLAAVLGALIVGIWSTVFWSPRIATLFYLILLLGLAKTPNSVRASALTHRQPARPAGAIKPTRRPTPPPAPPATETAPAAPRCA
ncbi:MAG: VanZ family protein, partial [Candidatus Competibacter sp.]|nr:VanZ family protein [Candidatus Competibacter sp.]